MGIEFVVIVTGVFVALSAEAWWSGQEDRALEEAYLDALAGDLDRSIIALDSGVVEVSRWIENLHVLAQADPDDPPSPDSLASLIANGLFSLEGYQVSLPSYQDLQSTGRLALIRDPELRRGLALLDTRMAELDEIAADFRESQHGIIDPALVRWGDLPMSIPHYDPSMVGVFPLRTPRLEGILRNEEFMSVVAFRTSLSGYVRAEYEYSLEFLRGLREIPALADRGR
jgi:hypothetical protein